MKSIAVVQARMGSTRLPGKVMKIINGRPAIEILFARLAVSKSLDNIVLATSNDKKNDKLVDLISSLGYPFIRGSEEDVLERYLNAANEFGADAIVRITGDCPLVDPEIVDKAVSFFKSGAYEYVSNISPPSFPDGLDVEVFSKDALYKSAKHARSAHEREHVTLHLRESGLFKVGNFCNDKDHSDIRWTLDEINDLEVLRVIFEHFAPDVLFGWEDALNFVRQYPEFMSQNTNIKRNEGMIMGKGQKLWKRAKNVIPGGNMLLSKRPEMFLPDQWPSYFTKSKGCKIWDMDGRQYIDMSLMGVGTNSLGYGHPEVDAAVSAAVKDGNMSSLNAPEEVYLAEKLIDMHPWADMARFARTGGEANAIAVRIARAASGKDKIAICGYHGWHDWYLSANIRGDEKLSSHLLPGLEAKGVPKNLKDTTFPFTYNNFQELQEIVDNHEIGAIKMEVSRNIGPQTGYLESVRDLASSKGIVLIFDECTSGFRETFGGLHKKFNVDPDVAIFGKAMGNGYAVTSVIGKREVMEVAQDSFISSTFWTERIGSVAALKTLEVMERDHSWKEITRVGLLIRAGWKRLAQKYDLKLTHFGLPALAGFNFNSSDNLKYKTLITQEMLKRGYLASNSIYACTNHSSQIIDEYIENLDDVFGMIKQCDEGMNIDEYLEGPVCHDGFKRLN